MIKILLYSVALLSMLQFAPYAFAQQNSSLVLRAPSVDMKTILHSVSPNVDVEYQGESIVVLKAYASLGSNDMSPFWKAIDAARHFGYTTVEVETSGTGSQGNPTTFYAVMSRP